MCDNDKCKAELNALPGKNLVDLGKIKCRAKIIDLYPDDELVLRLHYNTDDMMSYEEMRIYVDSWGKYIETTRLKKDKK